MSVENGKVCCNCRHCKRIKKEHGTFIECRCDRDNAYLTYSTVLGHWCRHWAKESEEQMSKKIKLIIEIPEEVYQNVKDKKFFISPWVDTAIANGTPITEGDLIKAFELLKAHCKNRECNKDCIFFRELAIGENKDQYCALCEIVTSDDKEKSE